MQCQVPKCVPHKPWRSVACVCSVTLSSPSTGLLFYTLISGVSTQLAQVLLAHDQSSLLCDRYEQQSPLSPLDGVPYAVKDMIDALPYQTTCGTSYMPLL